MILPANLTHLYSTSDHVADTQSLVKIRQNSRVLHETNKIYI